MCLGPKAPSVAPLPPPPPPPPRPQAAPKPSVGEQGVAKKRTGRSSLRSDLGGTGGGSGLNIPT